MAEDDWWIRAVDEFGLDTPAGIAPADAATVPDAAGEPIADDTVPEPRLRRRRRRRPFDWLVAGAIAVTAALALRLFVVQQFAVDGDSMLGTLHTGDRVVVNKLSYHLHDPRHGDIVVLEDTEAAVEDRDLIKRIIALPGETIEYRDCVLLIDGRRIDENYLDPDLVGPGHCGDGQAPVEVQPGHVFVMGDNRNESLDSRTSEIGQIPVGDIVGRAFVVVWPSSDWRWL